MECLEEVASLLSRKQFLSVDTETTGLSPYKGDKLFSIMIGDGENEYYFNFNSLAEKNSLLKYSLIPFLLPGAHTLFLHNAKFDMHFLYKEGLDLSDPRFTIHCTQAIGRVVKNDLLNYSLDSLAKEIGYEKSDEAKEWLIKNKGYDWIKRPGKASREKDFHYELVPFDIMFKYGCRDAEITHKLGMHQLNELHEMSVGNFSDVKVMNILHQERALTKVLFEMERTGIKVDEEYTIRARDHEQEVQRRCEGEFTSITGVPFKDSRSVLANAFDKLGEPYPKTAKGNASFKNDVLEKMTTPLARVLQRQRKAHKSAGTYYSNFLYMMDADHTIHTNIKQGGTGTGRMSCAEPNLQNLTKKYEEGAEFFVRKCFVPREGYKFAMIDYDQMEYRLMLEYAEQMELIEQVIGGVDVHTATAGVIGRSRSTAKKINFGLLYGMGVKKLGEDLGETYNSAKDIKEDYFSKLPDVAKLINGIISTARVQGNLFNRAGRVYRFEDPNFAYKAPNYLIQGHCADIVKKAMIDLHEYLRDKKSRMIMQIHDEILFEIHESEDSILPDLKRIMEEAFPYKLLPLTAGIETSAVSWNDKQEM